MQPVFYTPTTIPLLSFATLPKRAVSRPMSLLQAGEHCRFDLSRREISTQRVDHASGNHAGALIHPTGAVSS